MAIVRKLAISLMLGIVGPVILAIGGCAAPSALNKAGKANEGLKAALEGLQSRVLSTERTGVLRDLSEESSARNFIALSNDEWRTFETLACANSFALDRADAASMHGKSLRGPTKSARDAGNALSEFTDRVQAYVQDKDANDLGIAGWVKSGFEATKKLPFPEGSLEAPEAVSIDDPRSKPEQAEKNPSLGDRCTTVLAQERHRYEQSAAQQHVQAVGIFSASAPQAVRLLEPHAETPLIVAAPQTPLSAPARDSSQLGEPVAQAVPSISAPKTARDVESAILLRALANEASSTGAANGSSDTRLSFPARLSVIDSALTALDALAMNWAMQARLSGLKSFVSDVSERDFGDYAEKFAGTGSPLANVISAERSLSIARAATAYAASLPEPAAPPVPTNARRVAYEKQLAIKELSTALQVFDRTIKIDPIDIVKALKKAREEIFTAANYAPNAFDQLEIIFKQMHAIEQSLTTGLVTAGKSSGN